ncbi:beta-1,4-N-acetylgalactosaminyltransferase bre-4 [Biomphalaria glabrata]|nr:beta-1,4-N-acetylgalactosaminyltransferase bre-4 [Biomphalaria glabrata]
MITDVFMLDKFQHCNWEMVSFIDRHTIKLWLCSEQETHRITSTLCGLNHSSPTLHDARSIHTFYLQAEKYFPECHVLMYNCIMQSVISMVFKQQELLCSLANLNIPGYSFRDCVTKGNKKKDEVCDFRDIRIASCRMHEPDTDQTFSKALFSLSSQCQSQISHCADANPSAKYYVITERYCDFLNYQDNFTDLEACFRTDESCSLAELDLLEVAACGSRNLAAPNTFNSFAVILTLTLSLLTVDTSVDSTRMW